MMPFPAPFPSQDIPREEILSWLRQRVAGQESAIRRQDDGLFSLTLTLPWMVQVALPSGLDDLWFWSRARDEVALLGHGSAFCRDCADREELARAVRSLAWSHLDPDGTGTEPSAFLGHAFNDADAMGLPPARLVVPRILLRAIRGQCSLILSHDGPSGAPEAWIAAAERMFAALERPRDPGPASPLTRLETVPDEALYRARVEAARAAVSQGRLDKLVLSRRIRVRGVHAFDPARLAMSLSARYPECAVLAASFGRRVLLAASPEKLASRRGTRIESLALAGTAPRSENTAFPDRRLLASGKDRIEHLPVVRHIAAVLRDLCREEPVVPAEPVLMELGRLQHLATPVSGRLKQGVDLLDSVHALHPTPAIAGWPRPEALAMLDELGEERGGWYSGAMGWIDRAGDGEMSVILRCCVLDGDEAVLAAGGGIVAASTPDEELAETELKLAAILDSLKVA